MKDDKKEYMENSVTPPVRPAEDVTVEVDTIREEMPPELKKQLFPDDEPADPAKVRQNASTASKKEGYGEP